METIAVEHSSLKQSQIVKIEWNLGKRCNFNCSYCDEFTHDNKSKHLDFETAQRTIDKIFDKLGDKIIKINLTGGEPTVNPNIEQILKYMREKGALIGLTTNGSRTFEFYAGILQYIDSIIFSYHMEYHKREVIPENIVKLNDEIKKHDRYIHLHVHMMMLPGQFEEAKHAIQLFQDNGVDVVMRKIRPAYVKDDPNAEFDEQNRLISGKIAQPFYDGTTTLKFKGNSPTYEVDLGYYSEEEIKFLEDNRV